jgi:tetratricopeptide (TPR) repeat protein
VALAGNGQESDYLETGIALFKDGAYEESILEIRKYLGTYPSDRNALDYLNRAQTKLKEAEGLTSTESGKAPAEPNTAAPSSPAPTTATTRGVDAAGPGPDQQEQAQEFYEKGLRVYRSDLDQAISFWERSLLLDPHHTQTRLKLDQAYRMRERLQQIREQ